MFSNTFKKLRKILSWGVYQSIPDDDLLEKQRYKLFFTFSATCFLLCFAESFHALSFDIDASILATGLQTFAAIFLINYLVLQKHRNLKLAYTICLMTAFACVHLFNYYYGGIRNSGNFYFLFMIIATVIMLGNRQGWMMLGLSLVNQVYFYMISDKDWVQNVMATTDSSLNQDFVVTYGLAVIAIAALGNSLGSSKNIVIEKITESQNNLAEKNKELRKLSLVASKTDSAVIITDSAFRINWSNDAFSRLTGYTATEVAGRTPGDFLYTESTDQDLVNYMNRRLAMGKTFSGELEEMRKNGQTFWAQFTATPIKNDDGSIKEYIFLQNDITQRKQSEEKIKTYLRDLEITNKELDEFAYIVSHDLKAPLHAISNLTEWIEEDMQGKFSEDTSANFNIIKSRVSRMEDLINGLLAFARANHKKGEKTSVDLNNYIQEIIELCPIPENCTIAFPASLPVLFGDKIKFQQIFINLISNAIKYNDKTEVNITISAEEKENEWVISVKDNGPGIDPRFHDKVFVIFQTLNPRDTVESTGVGLAIVKKIIEEEGGKIWIETVTGQGADFRFTWLKQPKPELFEYETPNQYQQSK
jgi:PAS domain S-box-containing protein